MKRVVRRLSLLLLTLRVAWGVLPVVAGPAIADALATWPAGPRTAAGLGCWMVWLIVLIAMLVPSPVSLTAVRMSTAAGVVAIGWGAITQRDPIAAGAVVIACAVAFAPETGAQFVNGVAYPNERRYPLRVPGPLLAGPLLVAWALAVGAPVAAVLLLTAGEWVAGGAVAAVGLPVSVVLTRALHGLSRRWLVFVPAGVVVHDPLALADPVLFTRASIARFGPASADTNALDLTQRSLGLALELRVVEPARLMLARRPRATERETTVSAVLVTPTRPGAVLSEAAARGLRYEC